MCLQVVEEAQAPLAKYYRHISKGAWPFSSRDHGWPISDCSSEGLKAALALARLPAEVVSHRPRLFLRNTIQNTKARPAMAEHTLTL